MSEATSLNREITRISNTTDSNIALHLEPRGDQFTLRPGMQVVVVAYNSPEGRLEIDIESKRIAVWGWAGAMLELYHEGTKMMTDQGYIP